MSAEGQETKLVGAFASTSKNSDQSSSIFDKDGVNQVSYYKIKIMKVLINFFCKTGRIFWLVQPGLLGPVFRRRPERLSAICQQVNDRTILALHGDQTLNIHCRKEKSQREEGHGTLLSRAPSGCTFFELPSF